jgi:hypothetical protein
MYYEKHSTEKLRGRRFARRKTGLAMRILTMRIETRVFMMSIGAAACLTT